MVGNHHSSQNLHHLAAVITEHRRSLWQRIRRRHPHVQNQLQELDQAFGIGMEEAKVSDPPEAARQDVPEQQPEKFPTRHGADLTLSFVVLIAETDLTIRGH